MISFQIFFTYYNGGRICYAKYAIIIIGPNNANGIIKLVINYYLILFFPYFSELEVNNKRLDVEIYRVSSSIVLR